MQNLIGTTLPNSAQILALSDDTVLAWFRDSELVTWKIDEDLNAHWGSYHGTHATGALNSFQDRAGLAKVSPETVMLVALVAS